VFTKTKKEATIFTTTVTAIDRAGGILDQRARNRAAVREADRLIEQAEAAMATHRLALAEAEATGAGGEGQQSASAKAAADYRESRDGVEVLRIRHEGLDAAYAGLNRDLLAVGAELGAERSAFLKREIGNFEPKYLEAATAFATVLRQASALGAGLDFSLSNISRLDLPATLYSGTAKLYIGDDPKRWKSDPAAIAIYERLLPRLELHGKVKREIAAVTRELEEAEQIAARQRQNNHLQSGRQTTVLTVNENVDPGRQRADKDAAARKEAYERSLDDCRAPAKTDQEAA
jgi:hypothetical protein